MSVPTLTDSFNWYPGNNYESVVSLNIVDAYDDSLIPSGASLVDSWAVDVDGSGSIMCYEFSDLSLILAGNGSGKIMANANSSYFADSFQSLKTITGLEILDTSNVQTMERMFNECQSLARLDVSRFDTSSVTTMARMFYNCGSLTSLDLSSFSTASISASSGLELFACYCDSLTHIVLGQDFVHSADICPSPDRQRRNMFFTSTSNTSTTVVDANDVMLAYNWVSDKRLVTFDETRYLVAKGALCRIADAIRSKTGGTAKMTLSEMVDSIANI